jgi:hypothetical protein
MVFYCGPLTIMLPPQKLGPPPHMLPLTAYPPSKLKTLPPSHTARTPVDTYPLLTFSRAYRSPTVTSPPLTTQHVSPTPSPCHLHCHFSVPPLTSNTPLPPRPLPCHITPAPLHLSSPHTGADTFSVTATRFLPPGHHSLIVLCEFMPSPFPLSLSFLHFHLPFLYAKAQLRTCGRYLECDQLVFQVSS